MEQQESIVELEHLEAWFRQQGDPRPSPEFIEQLRARVTTAVQAHDFDAHEHPAPPAGVEQRLKMAMRQALHERSPAVRFGRRQILCATCAAVAAVIALVIASFDNIVPANPIGPADDLFEIQLATDAELSDLARAVEQLELRSLAFEYLSSYDTNEPDEVREALERIAKPDYQFELDM